MDVLSQVPDNWNWVPVVLAWFLPTPRAIVAWVVGKVFKK